MPRLTVIVFAVAALACALGAPEGREAGSCSDGADNDGDEAFDCEDDGCEGSPDCATGGDSAGDSSGDSAVTVPDACADITRTGDGEGDTPSDLAGDDQDGAPFSLYDSCEKGIVVISDTAWNAAGAIALADGQAAWEAYGPGRLTVVAALAEDTNGDPATQSDAERYADDHGLTFPVVADPSFAWAESLDGFDSAVPFVVFLEPGVRIVRMNHEIKESWIEDVLP